MTNKNTVSIGRIKVCIVSCDKIYSERLKDIIINDDSLWFYGEYSSGSNFIKFFESPFKPDVCLIDNNIKDYSGIELAKKIKLKNPNTHIILISDNVTSSSLAAARQYNADYIEKGTHIEGIINKIIDRQRFQTEQVISLNHAKHEGFEFIELANELELIQNRLKSLSENQAKVLQLKKIGMSVNDIAKTLGMNIETARTHIKRGLKKLKLPNILDYLAV
ncbi:MAG: response regulator [Spirochaetota bacterium]|nr:response regulator [Spirochaetota bacterium]